MSETATQNRTLRTIRLSDEQINALLDNLGSTNDKESQKRKAQRYRYRVKALVVRMQRPGFPAPVIYQVPAHDISSTGLSFLHGGYVHVGTRCTAQLITTYGTWDDVSGTVVRCAYVDGTIHDVGVRFDTPVNPAVYCTDAVQSRVLLVEDSPPIAKIATFHLHALNAVVDHVIDGKSAVDKAMSKTYDLILMDMELPVMNGFDATKALRENGYSGTIVAVTGLTQPEDKQRCLDAGCNQYLPKPFVKDDFAKILETLREEPLFSTFHDDDSMRDMIIAFVESLGGHVLTIEGARAKNDVDKLKATARVLKSEGTAYGFEVITEAAGQVESALHKGKTIEQTKDDINKLCKLCKQARGPIRSQSEATAGAPKSAGESSDDN